MPILIPQFPPVLDVTEGDPSISVGLRAAMPIRGTFQWEEFGAGGAWGVARGGTLLMQGPSLGAIPGNNADYRWWVWPRAQVVARLWCVSLGMRGVVGADHQARGYVATPIAGAQFGTWSLTPANVGRVVTFRFVERIASPSATPGEVSLRLHVDTSSASPVYMEGVCCYEISRATLIEYGAGPSPAPALGTLQTGALITEAGATAMSLDGLLSAVLDSDLMQTETRRGCLFSDWRPVGRRAGTSYTNLFVRDPTVLARARYTGESVREVAGKVYGNGPSGSTARITATTGDVVTVSLVVGVPGWHDFGIDIKTEDPARWGTDGGIRGGTRERLTIEGRRVGGAAGDCKIYGVCIGEDE